MTIFRCDIRLDGTEGAFGMSSVASIFALSALVGSLLAPAPSAADAESSMVHVNATSFSQGSPEGEADHRSHEGPVHEVALRPFSISRSEVTVAQFQTFVEKTGYVTEAERNVPVGGQSAEGCFSHRTLGEVSPGWVEGRSWRDPGFPQAPSHPAVCVSWNDANAYVKWLREETGLAYRLPSESEFEYVLRVGLFRDVDRREENELCRTANHGDQSLKNTFPAWNGATSGCSDGYAMSAPAASYRANLLGLYDVDGNVAEWVGDCWHESYVGAPANGNAWEAPDLSECRGRVLRGGDFVSSPANFGPAHRTWIPESFRTYHVGFRVAGNW